MVHALLLLVLICGGIALFAYRYLHSIHVKLHALNPTAQRCYHIDKLPAITTFIPRLLLFSIVKSQGKPLPYCQLTPPFQKEEKGEDKKKRPVLRTINALDP